MRLHRCIAMFHGINQLYNSISVSTGYTQTRACGTQLCISRYLPQSCISRSCLTYTLNTLPPGTGEQVSRRDEQVGR